MKREKATAGNVYGQEEGVTQTLWEMLHADNVGAILTSGPQGRLRMGAIITVTVCAAFGLAVSKAKTEVMRLQTEDAPAGVVH